MDREQIEEIMRDLNCLSSYAKMVYNLRYRKVPDGAVVLTGREYQSLRESLSETTNRECELADRARKLLHENDELKAENERIKEELESLRNDLINAECNLNHVTLQLNKKVRGRRRRY